MTKDRCVITKIELDGAMRQVVALVGADWRLKRVCFPRQDADATLLGSIHLGRVQRVLPHIGGAFVEIENHLVCYYPLDAGRDGAAHTVKAGDEILVQVVQEALKTKAPCVSSAISLAGNCLVLHTADRDVGVSAKLPAELRSAWREKIRRMLPEDRNYGVIVRTNAADAGEEEVCAELEELARTLKGVRRRAAHALPFTKIRDGVPPLVRFLQKIPWDTLDKVVTDQGTVYETLCASFPLRREKLEFYSDPLVSPAKLYRIAGGLEEALGERVYLRSGGFLVIQQTEALVAIDVNSGKNTGKRGREETYRQINREAACEIARQLVLRNLYGMILIDFINLKREEDKQELLTAMRGYVREDPSPVAVVDFTALNIMELTRKKESRSLREQIAQFRRTEVKGGERK